MNNGLPLVTALALAFAAGLLMLVSGTRKRLLEWKVDPRRCPSCSRRIRDCTCRFR